MKKLTREESKNILMSTIGSDMLGCYNKEQTRCVYYSPKTESFCAIGMLMNEIDPNFTNTIRKDGVIHNLNINDVYNGGSLTIGSICTELTKYTELTEDELVVLQCLHDRANKDDRASNILKYETFVAKL